MSDVARLSTKGQLVLPKSVRQRHGWTTGTNLVIEDHVAHVVLRSATSSGNLSWRDLVGAASYRGPGLSIQAMEKAVAAEARRSTPRRKA